MIDHIKGIMLRKSPAEVVVDVGGVAFLVTTPLTTSEQLGAIGSQVTLMTFLYVRQDVLALYGFSTERQRNLFVKLLGITGVGPKMGLAILSYFDPDMLVDIVRNGDVKRLTAIPGIGSKSAERLMVELKNRLNVKVDFASVSGVDSSTLSEAVRALESLGYTIKQAEEAARAAYDAIGRQASLEELVRQALRK